MKEYSLNSNYCKRIINLIMITERKVQCRVESLEHRHINCARRSPVQVEAMSSCCANLTPGSRAPVLATRASAIGARGVSPPAARVVCCCCWAPSEAVAPAAAAAAAGGARRGSAMSRGRAVMLNSCRCASRNTLAIVFSRIFSAWNSSSPDLRVHS